MEIKQLRYFVKVAELSSVGKASDFLNIAQPTLSRQIRPLELELKSNLFSRDGRGVQLTPRGRRFLEHARGILHAADTAMDALDEGKSVYEGKVIVGMTPSIGQRIIPNYISRFTERFPRASLSPSWKGIRSHSPSRSSWSSWISPCSSIPKPRRIL